MISDERWRAEAGPAAPLALLRHTGHGLFLVADLQEPPPERNAVGGEDPLLSPGDRRGRATFDQPLTLELAGQNQNYLAESSRELRIPIAGIQASAETLLRANPGRSTRKELTQQIQRLGQREAPPDPPGAASPVWWSLVGEVRVDVAAAYAQLSQLFAADGTPLHHQFSYLAIADLAAAAARAERHFEAKTLLERVLARLDPAPGPRLDQLTARARGLLAEPADAEILFAAALSNPTGGTWAFERAQLQLDYWEWLRRRRRINDAKPVLGAALETFRRLGAAPWTRRAEAELRACGVAAEPPSADPGALDGLTAQQREIVILAGHGLTNGEIADRLFLSPRTVASHLYRSYPKLGIAGGHQLRDLIDHVGTPQASG